MTSRDFSTHKERTHLAIEVSTHVGSLAFFRGTECVWHEQWQRAGSHSELVTPALERGLSASGLALKDLDFVGTSLGPGSFTGIRVGVNVAKTLGQSLDLPLVGVTTLDVLVHSIPANNYPKMRTIAALNAFKNMIYTMEYESQQGRWQALSRGPLAQTWAQLQDSLPADREYLFIGDGLRGYEAQVCPTTLARLKKPAGSEDYPSALTLGPLAYEQFKKGRSRSWQELTPLYVRASEAEEKLKSCRQNG